MIVNVESGVYSGFPQGTFDRELDAESMSPGEYGNEKMVGGAYQGEVLRRTLWGAASLFSAAFQARLEQAGPLTAADLSAFAAGGQAEGVLAALCSCPEDREVLADGTVRYTILKVRLLEVSVVTFPAYEETSVSARTRQEETIRKRLFAERKESLRKKLKGES